MQSSCGILLCADREAERGFKGLTQSDPSMLSISCVKLCIYEGALQRATSSRFSCWSLNSLNSLALPNHRATEPDPSAIEIWDSGPGTWRTAILKARHYSAAAVTSLGVEAQKVHQHHPWIVEFQNGRLPYRGRTGTCWDQLGVYIPGQ